MVKKSNKVDKFVDKVTKAYPGNQFVVLGNVDTSQVMILIEGSPRHKSVQKIILQLVDKMNIKRYTVIENITYTQSFEISDRATELDIRL